MACACSKKNEAPRTYTVTSASGEQKSYSSEIEAKAAAIRTGGVVRTVS